VGVGLDCLSQRSGSAGVISLLEPLIGECHQGIESPLRHAPSNQSEQVGYCGRSLPALFTRQPARGCAQELLEADLTLAG
jgi:hypothetical protein